MKQVKSKKGSLPKVIYDQESQVLSFVVSKKKSVDSDIQKNVVVDYDKSGQISRINFYDLNFAAFQPQFKILKNFVRKTQALELSGILR